MVVVMGLNYDFLLEIQKLNDELLSLLLLFFLLHHHHHLNLFDFHRHLVWLCRVLFHHRPHDSPVNQVLVVLMMAIIWNEQNYKKTKKFFNEFTVGADRAIQIRAKKARISKPFMIISWLLLLLLVVICLLEKLLF